MAETPSDTSPADLMARMAQSEGGADAIRPKAVGSPVQRVEDPRLLTGRGKYVDDIKAANMLHVAFARSDHPHGTIKGIDAETAREIPGVVAVLTAGDIAGKSRPVTATSKMKDYHATINPLLAEGKVRYVGEPVAAVLATSRYIAEDAAEQIYIDIEALPDVTDAEAAAEDGAPLLHDGAGTNIIARRAFTRGDPDGAMAAAAVRAGGRIRMRRKTASALENRAYLAIPDPGRQSLTLYTSSQVPGMIRDALADLLDMPGSNIRVVAPDVGGGFGGKSSLYSEEVLVSLAARMFERPVKWASDRMEDLTATTQSFDEIIDAEIGLDADGRIVAVTASVIGDVGAYSIYPWSAAIEPVQVVSFLPGPYRVENYRGAVKAVATSKAPTGPYRGVGRPVAAFVMERLVDMAAREAGLDAAELRARNLVNPDEFPYKIASGIVWDRSGFQECLAAARNAVGYDDLRREQETARENGKWLGIGIAAYAELTGIGSRISSSPGMPINTGTEISTIKIDATGAVEAAFGIASHGQGMETTLAQVVSDALGCDMSSIRIIHGDSAAVPHSTGTYASRGAVLAGGAATLAGKALREKVVKIASVMMEAAEGDIEIEEGVISVKGTDLRLSFPELARGFYSEMGRIPLDVRRDTDLEATKVYDPFLGTTSSAVHIAVIEIDPETYEISFRDYAVAEDCGRLINPMIVDGQVHGGVAQGIGAALLEEVVYDEGGQLLTASFVDYVVPSAAEIPDMKIAHVETELPNTIGGFRGMGEGGTIGAPAAVANAISDALAPLGIQVNELPATPERLFRLIEAARATSE